MKKLHIIYVILRGGSVVLCSLWRLLKLSLVRFLLAYWIMVVISVGNIIILVLELTSWTIWAVKFFMESLAQLGFIILWNILLCVQFMLTMSKWAARFKLAEASEFPVLAHLCLVLGPETLNISHLILFVVKYTFWFFYW